MLCIGRSRLDKIANWYTGLHHFYCNEGDTIIYCIFENAKPDPYRKYNQKHYLIHKEASWNIWVNNT